MAGRWLARVREEGLKQGKGADTTEAQAAGGDWPPECLAAERLYHQPPVLVAPHARLYPLIGRKVATPQGPGKLLQVFSDRAAVVLDADQGRVAFLAPEEIRPLAQPPGGGADSVGHVGRN